MRTFLRPRAPFTSALALVCGPACDVDADASAGAGAEPAAALDPTDPLHALVGSFSYEFANGGSTPTRFWLQSHATFDGGGGSWESESLPGGLDAGPTHPLASYSNGGDPDVMLLLGGKALFVGIVATGTYPHLVRNDLFVALLSRASSSRRRGSGPATRNATTSGSTRTRMARSSRGSRAGGPTRKSTPPR